MAGKGGGGAWKVAYADFVTAMMAFFLVMWITGQSKPVKQEIARYFEDPYGVRRGKTSTSTKGPKEAVMRGSDQSGRGPAKGLAMSDDQESKKPLPHGVDAYTKPKMIIYHDFRRTSSYGTTIAFPDYSSEIDHEAEHKLRQFIDSIKGKPNKVEIVPLRILEERNSEEIRADSEQLGFDRVLVVRDFLMQEGIDIQRIQLCSQADNELESTDLPEEWRIAGKHGQVILFSVDVHLSP